MPGVISDIISQHLEEGMFLWLLRDKATHAPHYSLADLARLDKRLEAHLDGLRTAEDAGWEISRVALGSEEPGMVFPASVLAFENGDRVRIQTVLDNGCKSLELSKGLISALGWIPYQFAQLHIERLWQSESLSVRRIGLATCAIHRQDLGLALKDALSAEDVSLRARAHKAVGELGRKDLSPALKTSLREEDGSVRYWAAWSGALLGEPAAVSVLMALASPGKAEGEMASAMALRRMDVTNAQAWQRELASRVESRRMAVIGAGVIGDPVLIPWLIEQMAVTELTRVAGEAFEMITGVDIAYEDLEGKWPEDFEAGPTESPDDENVEMDPDENLPWPNPDLILAWWNKNSGGFRSGTRYLLGKPISVEQCQHVLRNGYQRQRAAAAIELALLQPGQPLFEVRAPGFRQLQILGLTGKDR